MTYPQPQDQYPPPSEPAFVRPQKNRLIVPLLVVLAAVVVGVSVVAVVFLVRGGDGGGGVVDASNSVLEDIRKGCGLSPTYASIGDDGHTLTLEGQGDKESGLSFSEIECVLDRTKMPASVRGQFGHTRALDGMQSASWKEYSATWNYHPDSGVSLVITAK